MQVYVCVCVHNIHTLYDELVSLFYFIDSLSLFRSPDFLSVALSSSLACLLHPPLPCFFLRAEKASIYENCVANRTSHVQFTLGEATQKTSAQWVIGDVLRSVHVIQTRTLTTH